MSSSLDRLLSPPPKATGKVPGVQNGGAEICLSGIVERWHVAALAGRSKVRDELGDADKSDLPVDGGELETALGKISQVLADLYRQASQLVGQSEYNRGVVSLISHAVREISNNLAYHLGLAEDVPLPPRVDVTGAMANLTQLHEARSQWEDIPSEENGDAKPDDLAVAGQDVGDGA